MTILCTNRCRAAYSASEAKGKHSVTFPGPVKRSPSVFVGANRAPRKETDKNRFLFLRCTGSFRFRCRRRRRRPAPNGPGEAGLGWNGMLEGMDLHGAGHGPVPLGRTVGLPLRCSPVVTSGPASGRPRRHAVGLPRRRGGKDDPVGEWPSLHVTLWDSPDGVDEIRIPGAGEWPTPRAAPWDSPDGA